MKLKAHEIKVIDMLASNVFSSEIMKSLKENPTIKEIDVTGHGYFITIAHPSLPETRIICNKPMIIGSCNGVESTFLIFIENHELTIERAGVGEIEPPEDYKDCEIRH